MNPIEERRSEWRRQREEQAASGLSIAAWCRANNIHISTFNDRRKRLRAEETDLISASTAQRPIVDRAHWISVADSESKSETLTVRVGRVSIDVSAGFDQRLLRDVLAVLESR